MSLPSDAQYQNVANLRNSVQGNVVSDHSFSSMQVNGPMISGPMPQDIDDLKYSPIDGYKNNLELPKRGIVGHTLLRKKQNTNLNPEGVARSNQPSPRVISNEICAQSGNIEFDARNLTSMTWLWGQFTDHTITIIPNSSDTSLSISTGGSDPYFPNFTIPFTRSEHFVNEMGERQHFNNLACYLDAGNVYRFSHADSVWLRRLDGSGKLITSLTNDKSEVVLPTIGELKSKGKVPHMEAGPLFQNTDELFVGGDVRLNENIALISMHTLFVREHNYWCDYFFSPEGPNVKGATDEDVYQWARRMVSAIIQNITIIFKI